MKRAFVFAVAATLLPASAHAAQLTLSPANVYASSGDYSATYAANNILDQQTGIINEAQQDGSYWLSPDNGPAVGFISIDLGAAYQMTSFDLFNTHNAFVNDRGTGRFEIIGSSDAGFATSTLLVSGTLAAQSSANDPLDAQTFSVSGSGAYRYIQFRALGVASANPICCGIQNNYGLNELRAFGVAGVPEPATWGLMLGGFGVVGAAARRRTRPRIACA